MDHYINLGDCYNAAALSDLRGELTDAMKGHKACYDRAYRCLAAAADIQKNIYTCLTEFFQQEKLSKRIRGIISRELRTQGDGDGKITHRFLSALSCQGQICLWGTVQQYKKVYVLKDSYGFAHRFLLPLMTAATAAGHDVIVCSSPMDPERLEHLLIPSFGLAFVSSSPALPYNGKAYRHIHLDAMLDTESVRPLRPRLRFSAKIADALVQEGIRCLKEAKVLHDKLEAIYHPHVDFARIDAIAEELISTLPFD